MRHAANVRSLRDRLQTSLNSAAVLTLPVLALLALATNATRAQQPPQDRAVAEALVAATADTAESSTFVESPICGGDADSFITARHIVIRGTNFEIGRRLAELSQSRYAGKPATPPNDKLAVEQLAYFREKFPIHAERMRGVAAGFDGELTDTTKDFSTLGYGFVQAGCSVVFYPPATTTDGVGVLSRNFDFTTGTIEGKQPAEGQQAICAQPYVLELYPDEGYASLALVCYDLLGVVDGVNSAGLTVALLADDELVGRFGLYEDAGPQVGLDVLQVGRMLLDTCATVEEAKAALKNNKLYYTQIPCHYIVADRQGNSFVWENNREMTDGFVFPGDGQPLATTNFMRFLHDDLTDLPAESHPGGSFNRYRAICSAYAANNGPVSIEQVKTINASVAARMPVTRPGAVPGRTIWHSVYVPERGTLEVDFYLGEPAEKDGPLRRSGYQAFQLQGGTKQATEANEATAREAAADTKGKQE